MRSSSRWPSGLGLKKNVPLLEGRYEDEHTAPEGRNERYSVAVLDAQYEYFNPQEMDVKALQGPEDRERRQLEGPKADGDAAESEAA